MSGGLIEQIPPGRKIKLTRNYTARPSIALQLHQKLAAAKTADECWAIHLELAGLVKGASQGTRNKWRRLTEARIEAIGEEQRAARAAAPLIWTPPAPPAKKDEPLIVMARS